MGVPKDIILIRGSYTSTGGVERVALSLIDGLLKRGSKLTLLTLPNQHWPVRHPALRIIEVGISQGHRLIVAWAFNHAVNRFLTRNKADCILSLDKVTRFTHLHAGGGTHKAFLEIKAQYDNALSRLFIKLSLFHRFILYLEKKGFENRELQKVRCNSQLVMFDIQGGYDLPSDKLVLIHSGIRWAKMQDCYFERAQLGSQLSQKHDIDPRWTCILFLGSGFERKGLEIAIQGLCWIKPTFHLIVVGRGSSKKYKRLASSLGVAQRIHFFGPQPDGWRYAAMCKALVLPSHYDPFGGAAAEGNAMGLPVLVSDRTGYADLIQEGKNGVVLQMPATAQRIQQAFIALQRLIENPVWEPDRIREHARQVDDDVILEQLLENFF
jgi:UDP-glucose:(heptosyl)LPS alpha-1,3-glucosyltransferase